VRRGVLVEAMSSVTHITSMAQTIKVRFSIAVFKFLQEFHAAGKKHHEKNDELCIHRKGP
jgi:hypothetical protein